MCSAALSKAAISIGELSRRTGVNIETIRYYERINMMPHPPRSTSGRRAYGEVETRTLAFIRRARELGFCLDESVRCSRFLPITGMKCAARFVTSRLTTSKMFGQK